MRLQVPWNSPLLIVLAVAGCGMVEHDDTMSVPSEMQVAGSAELLQRFFSDATIFNLDNEQHGTQVEYHSTDGRSYLWYPGNRSVVQGQWRVESVPGGTRLCYLYGPNTYNPVLGTRGGNWECRRGGEAMLSQDVALKSDPFGLESGRIPFVIGDGGIYYPDELMTLWGRDPATLDYITNPEELD